MQHAILDAYDRGLSVSAIAAETGFTLHQVRRQLKYCGAADTKGPNRDNIASASAALLAAIRQHHPHQVRS